MDGGTIRTSRGEFCCDAESLLRILRILRAPDGCPWDRAQTRHTLTRHLAGEYFCIKFESSVCFLKTT